MYTTGQKFGVGKDVFERSLFWLHLLDQKYSKDSKMIFKFQIAFFYVNIF